MHELLLALRLCYFAGAVRRRLWAGPPRCQPESGSHDGQTGRIKNSPGAF